jgi:hypothetical protein
MVRPGPVQLERAACIALLLAGVLGLDACGGEESKPEMCNESPGALYDRRIAPLLADDQPKSCNQCHLAGVDLSKFVRNDACESMACLQKDGLVNLDSPEDSVILSWIGRAEPDSELITTEVIDAEREAFLEWIEHEAACGSCASTTCGEPDRDQFCGVSHDPTNDTPEARDPGGCDDVALEQLFKDTVFDARGRCYPCHFDNIARPIPGAVAWIAQDDTCEVAAATTMRRVIDGGYVNLDQPDQSYLLLKPLDPSEGGLPHGGSAKFQKENDAGYTNFLYWLTRYAECQTQ